MNRSLCLLFCALLLTQICFSQKSLEIKNIYDGTFRTKSVAFVNWTKDGQYYTALENNQVLKFDVVSGEVVDTLVDGQKLNIELDDYSMSSDESKFLLMTYRKSVYRRSYTAIFYVFDSKNNTSVLLSSGRQSNATFSPNGDRIAFTRENNLFVLDLRNGNEKALTTDGKINHIINGSTDWVYEEELYLTRAFEWSVDSKKIAYMRFDESKVKEYNMQVWNDGALYPEDYRFKYPKAGEDNSSIDIFIYDVTTDIRVKAQTGENKDVYFPKIVWTKNASLVAVQRLNRLQNELDILHINANTGTAVSVLNEKSKTYIDFTFCDDLRYLNDGKHFILSSERDGWKHFYLYDMSGQLIRQITKGSFEATDFVGINETAKIPQLFYLSTETSPLERQLYQVGVDGKGKKRLSSSSGISYINMSPDTKYYIEYQSSSTTPLQVSLIKTATNKIQGVLEKNEELLEISDSYQLAKKSFFTFKTEGDEILNGFFLLPISLDSTKQYPVLLFQYSGPGSQNVSNSWGGGHFIWHQYLVQKGYIVAVVDTRGTGYRGEKFKKQTYRELGKLEVIDLIQAGRWLGTVPFIDKNRIGVWGWSYGGYMSSLAILKGSDVFRAAIAVAPVTTWRFYDTIYTERYLQRPQDNPTGYDDNSPVKFADQLKGKFLLIHGTGDDNVHFQNAVALQNELIKAGKQFDSFFYPDLAHGLGYRGHLYEMMSQFIFENL